jgi:nicotinamide riboside kinase
MAMSAAGMGRMKIAIAGAPSTKKTTVADLSNEILKEAGYNSGVAHEYARAYIMDYGAPDRIIEQLFITQRQIELEAKMSTWHNVVICDSASFLGYIYGIRLDSEQPPYEVANEVVTNLRCELHSMVIRHIKSYHKIFYMPKNTKLVNDGVRYQDDEEAEEISQQIRAMMIAEQIPFDTLEGDVCSKALSIVDYVLWAMPLANQEV